MIVHPVGSSLGFDTTSDLNSRNSTKRSGLMGRLQSFIAFPFTQHHFEVSEAGSGPPKIHVKSGEAMMMGLYVAMENNKVLQVPTGKTSTLFLAVDKSYHGNGKLVFEGKGKTPSAKGYIPLANVTASKGKIKGILDRRPYSPQSYNKQRGGSIDGVKIGVSDKVECGETGVKSIEVEFDVPYRKYLESVVVNLEGITHPQIDLGWLRTVKKQKTGFVIKAKVIKSGPKGSKIDFRYHARGK